MAAHIANWCNLGLVSNKVIIAAISKKNNIICGYLLESHRLGNSNRYPQHMILWRTDGHLLKETPQKHLFFLVYFKSFTVLLVRDVHVLYCSMARRRVLT